MNTETASDKTKKDALDAIKPIEGTAIEDIIDKIAEGIYLSRSRDFIKIQTRDDVHTSMFLEGDFRRDLAAAVNNVFFGETRKDRWIRL